MTKEPVKKTRSLSHIGADGAARMVDVGGKQVTARVARAEAVVRLGRALTRRLRETGGAAKGGVIETARIAGIQAAKRTAELIPMCHLIPLDAIDIRVEFSDDALRIEATVSCRAATGAEMEALTAASVASLTVYDMCKSARRGIEIGPVRLLHKRGGRSGVWSREKHLGQD